MGGSSSSDLITYSFDIITQQVKAQQQVMEQLEEENRELRRHLTDLRTGHGIFLEIEGKRFPLLMQNDAALHSASPDAPPPVEVQSVQDKEVTTTKSTGQDVTETPTIAMSEVEINHVPAPAPEMPRSISTAQLPAIDEEEEQKQETYTPSFLEEAMLDEFAAAATSPMAVWTGPITPVNKQPETVEGSDEEKKAILRKELTGSFLLD